MDHQITGPPHAAADSLPRVLVVDDEEAVMITIQGILELDGYAVTATSNSQQALALVRTQTFDVVLTDLRLDTDIDGVCILRELRRHSADAVAIMLTGYASLESAVNALREGVYEYLFKPCDVLELRMAVRRGLERRRMAAQLRDRVDDLEAANETIRSLNLELEDRVSVATAELREQIAARDDFMATVAHDLKSPLTFIKGMASLRRRRATITPQTQPLVDALDQIEASADRMAQQLDAIVDAARLESGLALELRREKTDLVELAKNAVAQRQATSDRHVLQVTSTEQQVIGQWDQLRLARVLDSLLDNAVKYSPRGGAIEITIDTDTDTDDAVLTVRDRGEGIPPADLPHVFQRFRRGQNVEGRIPGTGIGLYGVRQLVELHGGSVTAESEIGVGTRITIRLARTA